MAESKGLRPHSTHDFGSLPSPVSEGLRQLVLRCHRTTLSLPHLRRYEKRHSNLAAHISPCFRCKEGDTVVVGQCRPLSKTVRFNVLRVIPAGSGNQKKGFSGF